MRETLTYIHFRVSWRLLGPDAPAPRFERKRFEEFMRRLNADSRIGDYDDFSYRPERCELAKVRGSHPTGGQAFSKVVYAGGELTVVEEWADIAADQFKDKFAGILRTWFDCFPETVAVIEQCCLRALVQPTSTDDARDFVGNRVLKLGDRLQQTFSAMPHKVGFTVSCTRSFAGGEQLLIDTKVSSWRDQRLVWLEVAGNAPMRSPINAANLAAAEQPVTMCRTFLENEVIRLLTHFDASEAREGGE